MLHIIAMNVTLDDGNRALEITELEGVNGRSDVRRGVLEASTVA
jgi:hypothetical protein